MNISSSGFLFWPYLWVEILQPLCAACASIYHHHSENVCFYFHVELLVFQRALCRLFKLSVRASQVLSMELFSNLLVQVCSALWVQGFIPLWVQEDMVDRIIHMDADIKGKCFFSLLSSAPKLYLTFQ